MRQNEILNKNLQTEQKDTLTSTTRKTILLETLSIEQDQTFIENCHIDTHSTIATIDSRALIVTTRPKME